MKLIQKITSDPFQQQTILLDDGTAFTIELYYRPLQKGWFITNLTYNSFVLTGVRVSNNPNILYQFKNKLPFGLACFSAQSREPMLQEDFSSGASNLFVLSTAEVDAYAEYLEIGN